MEKYHALPKAPFFHYSDDGDVIAGLNGEAFPSKQQIKRCIEALRQLSKTPQKEIDEYNAERELRLFIEKSKNV